MQKKIALLDVKSHIDTYLTERESIKEKLSVYNQVALTLTVCACILMWNVGTPGLIAFILPAGIAIARILKQKSMLEPVVSQITNSSSSAPYIPINQVFESGLFTLYDIYDVTLVGAIAFFIKVVWGKKHALTFQEKCSRHTMPSLFDGFNKACNNNNIELAEQIYKLSKTHPDSNFAHWRFIVESCQNNQVEIVAMLLQNGANVDEVYPEDNGSLLSDAISKNNTELIALLFKHDVTVTSKDKVGKTPLYWAARHGRVDLAKQLIEKGAKVEAVLSNGTTLLHVASEFGHTPFVRLLLNYQIDLNARREKGVVPLVDAVRNGHYDVVELLLQNGANALEKTKDGRTSLAIAKRAGHKEIAKLLAPHFGDKAVKILMQTPTQKEFDQQQSRAEKAQLDAILLGVLETINDRLFADYRECVEAGSHLYDDIRLDNIDKFELSIDIADYFNIEGIIDESMWEEVTTPLDIAYYLSKNYTITKSPSGSTSIKPQQKKACPDCQSTNLVEKSTSSGGYAGAFVGGAVGGVLGAAIGREMSKKTETFFVCENCNSVLKKSALITSAPASGPKSHFDGSCRECGAAVPLKWGIEVSNGLCGNCYNQHN